MNAQHYRKLGKAERGPVSRFLSKVTGLSRAQVNRSIARGRRTGPVVREAAKPRGRATPHFWTDSGERFGLCVVLDHYPESPDFTISAVLRTPPQTKSGILKWRNLDVIVPRALVNQTEIAASVERAAQLLKPDVVRIRYQFGEDWTGDPSIFFRVLISDEASREPNLRQLSQRIAATLRDQVQAEEQGVNVYFNLRSVSEQAQLNEPAWA